MNGRRFAAPCVTVVALCLPAAVGAQADTPETPWRLWGGVGGGLASKGAGGMGELVFQKGPHQITARALVQVDPLAEAGQPVGEIGLLYGRTAMSRQGHVSISAGLAVTDTDMDSEEGMTLGVPIVGEAALRLLPFLGLGAQLYTNLNPNESYLGGALFMQLGYVRSAP